MADEVRNTQTTIEILREAGGQKGRVTQSTVEVMREAEGQVGRVTQTTVEVMREAELNDYNYVQFAHQLELTLGRPTTYMNNNTVEVAHQLIMTLVHIPKKPSAQITIIT